ncbi:Vacuolar protein-sorting protein BRO1 [Candida viswanathii]|uniref:BRO domain-containing protein 1 n=1 Tax=Candida viswanathii TaxID=5486 RepID=A0A367YP74_9ASCO|nr:Vacuolar protein-sorting protein BRO1 [Candida viswanathii]
MKTHLLVIPNKKTEEVNWIKPLNNYLLSVYGNTSQFQDDLHSFNKLRQDIRGVNADTTGLRLYYTYYSQLELIDLRVPFHDVNKSKKLEFEWHDSFSGLVHKQNALPFEKANVLYNIGSLLSKFANHKYSELQSSDGEKSFKELVLMLQQAAGVFQFINENFLHAPSEDLAQATIKFLGKLMIAQSQEIFTLRVVTGDTNQLKNSLISKLCKSTSILYEDCYNMINQDRKQAYSYMDDDDDDGEDYEDDFLERPEDREDQDLHSVVAELDSSWIATIYFKYQYYKSLALYFHGLQLESGRKYGDAIAYLTKSRDVLNEIHNSTLKQVSKGTGDVYELLDNYKYQKDAVTIKLNDLNKDNDLIYHDIVPSLVTLPEIKPMDSTKVISLSDNATFHEVNEKNYNNFLVNVVPVNIHELSSFYSEEKSQYLRNEIDHFEVSNEEALSALEYLKFPKALVAIKESLKEENDDVVSPDIIKKVQEIASNYKEDEDRKRNIESSKSEFYLLIGYMDQNNRKDEAVRFKKVLFDASTSDQKLFSLVDSKYFAILGKGPTSPEFKGLFEVSNQGPEVSLLDMDDTQDKQITLIEDLLNDLNTIKTAKAKLIERLKKEIHSDDISDILVLNMKLKSSNEIKSVIFPQELKKFNPFTEELDKLISQEKSILAELKSQWGKLTSNPEIKKLQSSLNSRGQLIATELVKINDFYNNWTKYHAGLVKGEAFYKGVLDHCRNIKNDIDDLSKGMRNINIGEQYPQPMLNRTESSNLLSNYTGGSSSSGYQQQQYQQQPPQASGGYNQPPPAPVGYQPPSRSGSYQQALVPGSFQQPQASGGFQQPQYTNYQQQQQQQPSLRSQYSQGSIPQQHGYDRPAPQLPPKQSFAPTNYYSQQNAPQRPHDSQNPPWQQQAQPQSKSSSESNLIYDNPSTYNPNMYNFFSNK